jgi:hypothetical protein
MKVFRNPSFENTDTMNVGDIISYRNDAGTLVEGKIKKKYKLSVELTDPEVRPIGVARILSCHPPGTAIPAAQPALASRTASARLPMSREKGKYISWPF